MINRATLLLALVAVAQARSLLVSCQLFEKLR